jgi:membrane fusion protein, multidrug efflux system
MKAQCALVMIVSAAFGLCSCTADKSAAAAPSPSMNTSAATSASAERPLEVSAPVLVENQIEVLAQRDGVISSLAVDADTRVAKGQLLATLDDRQLVAERDAAAAKMRAIAADVKNWEADQQIVEMDLNRDDEMFKANLITRKQLEHSRTKLEGTKYEVERERQNYLNAEANLKALELELEKTRIVAPFSGVVARRYVRAGQRVAASDKLFWVTATEPLLLRFSVPEGYAAKIKRGQSVTVLAPAASSGEFRAAITMVSPVVDPGSGTIDVQAKLISPTAGLLPGMTAIVRLSEAK